MKPKKPKRVWVATDWRGGVPVILKCKGCGRKSQAAICLGVSFLAKGTHRVKVGEQP